MALARTADAPPAGFTWGYFLPRPVLATFLLIVAALVASTATRRASRFLYAACALFPLPYAAACALIARNWGLSWPITTPRACSPCSARPICSPPSRPTAPGCATPPRSGSRLHARPRDAPVRRRRPRGDRADARPGDRRCSPSRPCWRISTATPRSTPSSAPSPPISPPPSTRRSAPSSSTAQPGSPPSGRCSPSA
ncbi:MAG: hypothetical protein U0841_24255 [Chloroflexia bacterium]